MGLFVAVAGYMLAGSSGYICLHMVEERICALIAELGRWGRNNKDAIGMFLHLFRASFCDPSLAVRMLCTLRK